MNLKPKAFTHWPITAKIATSASLLVALAVAVSLVGLSGLRSMEKAVDIVGQVSGILVSVNTANERVEHFIAERDQDSLTKAKTIIVDTLGRISTLAAVPPDEAPLLTTGLQQFSNAIDMLRMATDSMDTETSNMKTNHAMLRKAAREIEHDIEKRRKLHSKRMVDHNGLLDKYEEGKRILQIIHKGERKATSILARMVAGDQTAFPGEARNVCKALQPVLDMLDGLLDEAEWSVNLAQLRTSFTQAEQDIDEITRTSASRQLTLGNEALQRLEKAHDRVDILEKMVQAKDEKLARTTDDLRTEAGLLQNNVHISKQFAERVAKLEAQTFAFRLSPTDETAGLVTNILDQLSRYARVLPSAGPAKGQNPLLSVNDQIDGYRAAFDRFRLASKELERTHDQVRQEAARTSSLVTRFAKEQHLVAIENRQRGDMVTVLTCIFAVLITLLITVNASRAIARPIVALAAIMRRLAEGHLEENIVGLHRGDELGNMSRAVKVFQDNALRVRALEEQAEVERQRVLAQLENMVAQRTQELQQTNTMLYEKIIEHTQAEHEIRRLNEELEQKVEERTRQIKRLVDSNIIGICFWEQNENIFGANDAFLAIIGRDRAELDEGRVRWSVLSPPEYIDVDKEAKRELEHSGTSRPYEKELIRTDGIRVPVLVGNALLSGSTNRGVSFVLDQSERKKAELELRHNQELLQSVLDNSTAVISLKDIEGRYIQVNKKFTELFHISREDILGMTDHDVFPVEMADTFRESDMRVLTAGGPIEGEEVTPHDDGPHTYISLKYPLFNTAGKPYAVCGISTDITERLRAEAEQQARQAAESANKAKSEFLANMSHEIRTPMNAIRGLSYLLLQTDLTILQRDYVKKIKNAQDSLLGLINDILDFSKIEAGKLSIEFTPFSLEELLNDVTGMLLQDVEHKGLELVSRLAVDIPSRVEGDPLRIRQVLTNLLSNAVKFTEQGEVVLSIDRLTDDKQDGKNRTILQFSVRDTGIGLTPEQQTKLFQSFSQVDVSTTRKYGGTGLGLAISQRLVHLMDGEIGVESEYGKGSRFFFTLPLIIDTAASLQELTVPTELSGLRILLTDDNQTSRSILSAYLHSFGYAVHAVSSGAKALALLKEQTTSFDLAILDWRMPDLDGLETARRIRSTPQLDGSLPMIMISAYGKEDIIREAVKVGINSFLVKPVNPSVLFDTILETLGYEAGRKAPAAPHSDEQKAKRRQIHSARVLVVDDNPLNRRISKEILKTLGINATVAASGQEALDALGMNSFDAVLMDVQMPEMDGFQTTRLLRRSSDIRQLPVIALTAHALSGDKEKCLEAGMNDYLTKPIDPDQLLDVLVRWITPRQETADEADRVHDPVNSLSTNLPADTLNFPGIDTEDGLKRFSGHTTIYLRLLREFHAHCLEYSAPISNALNRGELQVAARLIHTIKGTAGNVGAKAMYETSVKLEKAIRDGNTESIAEFAEMFTKELGLLITSLETLNEKEPQLSSGHDPTADAASARHILVELENRMKGNLYVEGELLDQLESVLPDQQELVAGLIRCVNGMDYHNGLEHLEKLMELLTSGDES